jgi:inner membrane protein
MDNITHSLTGALAAKLIAHTSTGEKKDGGRTLFWLLVVSANLPDADIALRWVSDYFSYVVAHRGITHSVVFAPILALIPAGVFFFFSREKTFSLLWLVALLGIVIHICFDVITSFGTRILAPLSSQRHSLDWMFIIDPLFTGILAVTMILQRQFAQNARSITRGGFVFACVYLLAATISHTIATTKIERAIAERSIQASQVSAIPQPFSILHWNGLIQTGEGVQQAFFSVFNDSLHFVEYTNSTDALVETVLATKEVKDYFTFTRHPWISSRSEGEKKIVELRDFQFGVAPWLLELFGQQGTPQPFSLRYEFAPAGNIESVRFNDQPISQ